MKILPITLINKHFDFLIKVFVFLSVSSFLLMVYLIINSPSDYLQDNLVKIMYIHVPAAWLSMMIYSTISLLSALFIIFKNSQYFILARLLSKIGITYTLVALITGAIWGKPTWGTWWVWDARLTSMLFLFFIYAGYRSVANYNIHNERMAYVASYYAISGFIVIPLIKFSVDIWTTLHQPSSVFRLDGPTIHYSIFKILIISLSFHVFFTCLNLIIAIRSELNIRKIISSLKHGTNQTTTS